VRTRAPSPNRGASVERGRVGHKRAGAGPLVFIDPGGVERLAWRVRAPNIIDIEPDNEIQIGGDGTGTFVNGDGTDVTVGEVVVLVGGTAVTTTIAQDTRPVGVVVSGGADGDPVLVQTVGVVGQVNTIGTVLEGDFLETSTTAGAAQANATRRTGSFAVALAAGPNPPALLFGIPDDSTSSGDGMVPYYIPVDETFTVPLYRQALFSEAIEVDGALVVNGLLLGVD